MRRVLKLVALLHFIVVLASSQGLDAPAWPPPPDQARVKFVGELRCDELSRERSFIGSIGKVLSGESADDRIGLPFDLAFLDDRLFLTCQNLSALVEVNLDKKSYRLHRNEDLPLAHPIGLSGYDDSVYLTDSERGAVYRFRDGDLDVLISEGLVRPTGIVVLGESEELFVVDTGDHSIKAFDLDGNFKERVGVRGAFDEGLNFPTFATGGPGGELWINDSLNYRIKRFDTEGQLLGSFGEEGDGPGTFARPKGIALDGDGNLYVVDTLFDNIQVFAPDGRLLLVIGGGGQAPGQFWSPGGIDIDDNTIFIADTFNHRIQILEYLGGRP